MEMNQAQSLVTSLENMISNIESGDPIIDQLTEIDRLQREVEATAPPQLTHFLQRRSYTKALEFLKAGIVIDDPNRPDCDEEEAHP